MLYAISFSAGIALKRQKPFWFFMLFFLMLFSSAAYAQRQKRRKQRIALCDRLFFFSLLFLLSGYLVLSLADKRYAVLSDNLKEVMKEEFLLAEGRVSHLSKSKDGVRFELSHAFASAYQEEKPLVPVGSLLIFSSETDFSRLKEGRTVRVFGKGREVKPAENPGQFDAKDYYFSQSITGTISASAFRITCEDYCRFQQILFEIKESFLNVFLTYFGEEKTGVLASMLLGERALLSEETRERYEQGGISHLLAISGLHVSLIGVCLFSLLKRTGLGRNKSILVASGLVLFYGFFTGAGTSTKRAVLMLLLQLLSKLCGRTYDSLSAMAISMIMILLFSPGALFTASFQLSFAAAYGAAILSIETEKKQRNAFSQSLLIQLSTLPFTAIHFFQVPVYGFLINPILLPFVTLLLLSAFLTGVTGLFSPMLAHFFAGGASAILSLNDLVCRLVKGLPFSMFLFGQPDVWQIFVYFLFLFVFFYRKRQKGMKWKRKEIICLSFFLPILLIPVKRRGAEITFLSVGQGDGAVITIDQRKTVLIDGGSLDVGKVGTNRIEPFLFSKGIRVIESVFVSHYDSDHINGITELLEKMPKVSSYTLSTAGFQGRVMIQSLILPVLPEEESAIQLCELAKEKGVAVGFISNGNAILFGSEVKIKCLAPEPGREYESSNAGSMVLLCSLYDRQILFTGDITKEEEGNLLTELYGERVDVIKVPHHGSDTSSSDEFISSLRAGAAIISCGEKNRFGHPKREIVKRYEAASATVFRTDLNGCIIVHINRKGRLTVRPFLQAGP